MEESVVVVSAVRTPIGRRGRGLAEVHPVRLLGAAQRAAVADAGIDPGLVGQVIGGTVAQVGEQSFNASRTAWLAEGLPEDVPATTVDAQCGSSQQAVTLATGLVASGITDLALACGVESMSRLPIGSQISDGASAVLLTTERRAGELGLTPLARVVDSVLVGVDPVMMLLGPHAAAPKLLERNHLTMDDLDLIEINEAFASIVVSFQDKTKADPAKINPNGGAIALGHPLGATGCVLTTKAVHELRRTGGRYGLVTMCCGGGLGTATLLERI